MFQFNIVILKHL